MTPSPEIGALVLAAGRSRRFGGDKRRARLGDGRSLLEATVTRYLAVVPAVRVVLRPEDDAAALLSTATRQAEVVRAADADLGMGHSLAAGLADCSWEAAFVVLGDMPGVAQSTLRVLTEAWASSGDRASAIVRPRHDGHAGHPVCFGSDHFPALRHLHGDRGARDYLDGRNVVELDVEDPGVVVDVDTREALKSLTAAIPEDGAP